MKPAAKKVADVIGELTGSWKMCQIQEVAEVNPRIDKKAIPDDIEVSFLPMPAVEAESGRIDVSQTRIAKEVKKGFTAFLEGDVLFAKITPCMENGKMAIVPPLVNGYGFGSTEFHVLRAGMGLHPKYLYYYVSSKTFRGEAERFMTGAVGQKRVSTTYIKEATIPVAPLDDQRRIVAEIEKQFSRLDEAIASLKRVKANLKRYKAAVLKAAVEGKLTEEWRKQNPDVEPASKLLERILAERRTKWEEAELAKMKAKGKEPKDDRWKEKYKELDERGEPTDKFPVTWLRVSVDAICSVVSGFAFKSGDFEAEGIPAVKIANVGYGGFLWKQQQYLPEKYIDQYPEFIVKGGDTLLALTRPITHDTVKVCFYPHDAKDGLLNQRVATLRPFAAYEHQFFLSYLQSDLFKRQVESGLSETLQPNLSPVLLKQFYVPLPPAPEQSEILKEVSRLLSVTDRLERDVAGSLKRTGRIRQSVLRSAFLGQICRLDG